MKYIKIYEDMRPVNKVEDASFEKLFNHFDKIFSNLGYHSVDYEEIRTKEFYKDHDYMFTFAIKTRLSALLIYKKSISNQDEIQNFIPEYFKTIKGLKYMGEKYSGAIDFEIAPYMYKTTDLVHNIDDIISQISLENFQLKFDSFKYNI